MRTYYYLFDPSTTLPIGGPYTSLQRLATAVKKRPLETLRAQRVVQGLYRDLTPTESEALVAILSG
jgi:hypothetical protein